MEPARQAWAPCSPGSRWHEASRPKGPARQRQAGSRSRTRRSRRRWPRRQHRRQLWVMASRASSRISASVTSDTELRICCCSLSARVMGTACGRASVLGSALIHTKTGAHREDVAQHAGDRFGGPITRRPDAAALSDGADSPPVSIPALRMPPRKPQMTGRTGRVWADCLNLQQLLSKTGRTVTDQDRAQPRKTTSRSVTVRGHFPR